MILNFDTNGNEKQKECARLWVDYITKDILYGGGKGCFAADTLVLTSKGYKPISTINKNELVLSYNVVSGDFEYKKVLDTFIYGGGSYKQEFCTFVLENNIEIKCTSNHEFYFEGSWIAAKELTQRAMEARTPNRKPIFNIEQGAINDDWIQRVCAGKPMQRGKGVELKVDRKRGYRDKEEIPTEDTHKGNVSGGIQGKAIHNKRYSAEKIMAAREIKINEIVSITITIENTPHYDLCIDGNHNYTVTKENIIVHNSGKSYLGCTLIFGDAFMYPETNYFIARKTLADLRKFTRPSIEEVFKHWGITDKYYRFDGKDNFYELHNGSKVFLLDAKYMPSDPHYYRFGSMQMTRGWIEEAGEFELEAKNNLNASIGRWKNDKYNLPPKLLQTCNPAKNYLYADYYKAWKEWKLPSWRSFIQALPEDNKKLPKGYIENLYNILSPNEIERLLKGNWEYDDNPYALFDYNDIINIFTNEFIYDPAAKKYITADIAYEGSDLFVIGYWEGFTLKRIWAIDKIDETQVSKKIHEIRLECRVPITNVAYDADGLKTFVRHSANHGHLVDARQFHNNGSPIRIEGQQENFKNLKAQCYYLLAEKVKNNEIYIACKEYRKQIIEELEQICKLPLTDDGKIALERKQALKERLRRSPDFADMLMMRMLFELDASPELIIEWN